MSKAITEKADERTTGAAALAGGSGPSVHIEDEPTFARVCGLVGFVFTVIGCVVLYMTLLGGKPNLTIGPGWGGLALFLGVCGLLFHAVMDKDLQYRLLYLAVGA